MQAAYPTAVLPAKAAPAQGRQMGKPRLRPCAFAMDKEIPPRGASEDPGAAEKLPQRGLHHLQKGVPRFIHIEIPLQILTICSGFYYFILESDKKL